MAESTVSVPVVNVRVGVGCMITSPSHPGCTLMGTRKGSHGAGRLSWPGGHLEMNESWAECAHREVKEETNLDLVDMKYVHTTNDPCISGNPNKHYITIIMTANVSPDSAELINMEPQKCLSWDWVKWSDVLDIYQNDRGRLFDPLIHFIEDGKVLEN